MFWSDMNLKIVSKQRFLEKKFNILFNQIAIAKENKNVIVTLESNTFLFHTHQIYWVLFHQSSWLLIHKAQSV